MHRFLQAMKFNIALVTWLCLQATAFVSAQPVMMMAPIEDPGFEMLRQEPRLELPQLEPQLTGILDRGMARMEVASAVKTELSGVQAKIATQERVDKQAFDAGIDRAIAPSTDPVGPHLLTQASAFDIERAGKAFLEVSSGTVERLHVPTKQASAEFSRARIMPPDLPGPLRCPYDRSKWPQCDSSAKYRTYDGSCNNQNNPLWGRAMTPFERFMHPWYEDGVSSPRQRSFSNVPLPNPRKISFEFHQPLSYFMVDLNHLAMAYGQFVSHDLQFNALSRGYGNTNLDCCGRPGRKNCMPIMIPSDDPFFHNRTCMNFVRALPTPNLDCTLGVREQLNQNTHFHDASQVYGSSKAAADALRTFTDGLLKTSGDLLPKDPSTGVGCIKTSQARPCFRAGDARVNAEPGLTSLHTVWVREHNRLAKRLAQVNPAWRGDDETLYQEARRIVVAMLQHVTYNEYLPEILGPANMNKYGLKPKSSGYYYGYDRNEKPMIRNGFAAAAYRFGHSMIRDTMPTHNGMIQTSNNLLKDLFLKPDLVYTRGIDEIARGLTRSKSEVVDEYITAQVTRHLFERQPQHGGDLAAINIHRGRDHGIPQYKLWRRHCGLTGDYSHTHSVKQALQRVYRDPVDMDLFTAGVSEIPVPDGKVGPTFACLIGEQFRSLKKGDRFYYENDGQNSFTSDQLRQIRKVTMSKIFCRNTNIPHIQRNAFKDVIPGNPLVNCRNIGDIDLAPWGPVGGGCIPVHGGWSSWRRTTCYGSFRIRYRLCNNPYPNACGRPCLSSGQPFEIQMEFCGLPFWRGLEPRLEPRRQDFGPETPRSMDRQAMAPDTAASSILTSELENTISKMLTPGQKSISANAFEKAVARASASVRPQVAPVGPVIRPVRPEIGPELLPREDMFRRGMDRAPLAAL